MKLSFSKYQGTGNDFIVIDDRKGGISIDAQRLSVLCHRQYGIGADGMIFLRPSERGDFSMHIFNADGSQAEMCGNGLRCLIQFLKDLGEKGSTFEIETMKKVYPCTFKDERVVVSMGVPHILEERDCEMLLEVGVPHLVVFVDDLSRFDREAAKRFSDLRVNINYIKLERSQTLRMRTFERGVEGETFSCGSGATAACMAAWKKAGWAGKIEVIFDSGERLMYELITKGKALVDMTMSGNAHHVFTGEVQV